MGRRRKGRIYEVTEEERKEGKGKISNDGEEKRDLRRGKEEEGRI